MTHRITATDRVHSLLHEEIITGELASGSLHSIYDMAERLSVSRTPVRDAVLRLADAGMVTIERNRGVRIRGLGVREIQEVFEARLLLEVPPAGFAAGHASPGLLAELRDLLDDLDAAVESNDTVEFNRRDRELHRAIILATGNQRVADLVDSLRDATQAYGASTIDRSRTTREVHNEHVPIIDAISRGDSAGASRLMRAHLTATGLLLMRQVASVTGEPIPEPWPRPNLC